MLDITTWNLHGDLNPNATPVGMNINWIVSDTGPATFHTGGSIGGSSVTPYSGGSCLKVPQDSSSGGLQAGRSSGGLGPWTAEAKFLLASTTESQFGLYSQTWIETDYIGMTVDQGVYYGNTVGGFAGWKATLSGYGQPYPGSLAPAAIPLTRNVWHRVVMQFSNNSVVVKLYLGANISGTTPDLVSSYRTIYDPRNLLGELPTYLFRVRAVNISSAFVLVNELKLANGLWQGSVLDPTGVGRISQKDTSNAWAIGTFPPAPPVTTSADSHWGLDLEGNVV
jgi:hypothetical protein